MPRLPRIVVPGASHHVTQRGNNREVTFFDDDDRWRYLELLKKICAHHRLLVEAYCLMRNHVHLIVIPLTPAALGKAIGHAHWLYSQYFNVRHGRCGHVWHSRYYSCPMDGEHRRSALVYTERNPMRAKIVQGPSDYPWSSAAAHCGGDDPSGLLDMEKWRREWDPVVWRDILGCTLATKEVETIRKSTNTGRPLGSEQWVKGLESRLGRRLRARPRGRPRKKKLA